MREIEYRGKRKDNGEWIFGDLLQGCEICNICEISDKSSIDGTRYEVNPETVGEYTGLKDKNGVKIYEGDIVQQYNIKANGIIQYKHCQFGIVCLAMFWNIHTPQVEVIGNIHDNPELLEGE